MSLVSCSRRQLNQYASSAGVLPILPVLPLWILISPMVVHAIQWTGEVDGAWWWHSGSLFLSWLIGTWLMCLVSINYRSPLSGLINDGLRLPVVELVMQVCVGGVSIIVLIAYLIPMDMSLLPSVSGEVVVASNLVAIIMIVGLCTSPAIMLWVCVQLEQQGKPCLREEEGEWRIILEGATTSIARALVVLPKCSALIKLVMRVLVYLTFVLFVLLLMVPSSAKSWPMLLIFAVLFIWQLRVIFPLLLKSTMYAKINQQALEVTGKGH